MRTSFFLSLITALTILVIPAKAEWISPADYQQMLGSGIDVDWWQEGNGYQVQNWDDVIYDFRQAGVQHLRITIEQEVMRPADFVILDEQINHCIRHGIIPIISYRPPYSGRYTTRQREHIARWWSIMANHYRYYSARLSFDILPEPNNTMFASYNDLNLFYEDCVNVIRVTNPYRIIFIAPTYNSDPMYLQYLRIPSRANGYLMAEWHFMSRNHYRNFWNRWNSHRAYEERWLRARIETALAWQRRTGIYTWMGSWAPGIYAGTTYYAAPASLTEFLSATLISISMPYAVHGIHHYYDYHNRSWKHTAQKPMQAYFPRGHFAHSGIPVGGNAHKQNGFAIGNHRFDNNRNEFRTSGRQERHNSGVTISNRQPNKRETARNSNPSSTSNNGFINSGGNGRSTNEVRFGSNTPSNRSNASTRQTSSRQPTQTTVSQSNPGRQNVSSSSNRPIINRQTSNRQSAQAPTTATSRTTNNSNTKTTSQSTGRASQQNQSKQKQARPVGGFTRNGNNK